MRSGVRRGQATRAGPEGLWAEVKHLDDVVVVRTASGGRDRTDCLLRKNTGGTADSGEEAGASSKLVCCALRKSKPTLVSCLQRARPPFPSFLGGGPAPYLLAGPAIKGSWPCDPCPLFREVPASLILVGRLCWKPPSPP